MEIVSKTILLQIITQCTGTQDIIKKLASCGPRGRKSGFKSVAFLLRLSIFAGFEISFWAKNHHYFSLKLHNVTFGYF